MPQNKSAYNPSMGLYILGGIILILIAGWYIAKQYILPQFVNSLVKTSVTTAIDSLKDSDFSQASTTSISHTIDGDGVALVINSNKAVFHIDALGDEGSITGEIKHLDSQAPDISTETKTMPENNNIATFMSITSQNENAENYKLHIPQDMPVALQINIGAGELDIDLTDSFTEFISVNLGAGDIDVTFPSEGSVEATFNTGAGDINLHIPKNVGKQIVFVQGVPSDLQLGGEMLKTENGFKSANYETAAFKANITLVQAVGGFTLTIIE